MKIFITGGSGFLGSKTIKKLLESGHEVTALVRSESSLKKVSGIGVKTINGDLDDITKFESIFSKVDAVVHCAAPVEFWGKWEKFDNQIVQASINLARKASDFGVKRFIHISSESVLQDRNPLVGINETYPYPDRPNSYYGKAKKNAELALLSFETKMEIIILRPTFIYGPGCPSFETILNKANSGQFLWIDHGKSEFEAVHIENVASAILCALKNGKSKSIYFITDDQKRTVRDFFEKIFIEYKVKVPTMSIPNYLAEVAAGVIECVWLNLKIYSPPPLSKFELAFIAQPRRYDITKAKTELGYSPLNFDLSLK